MEDVDRGDEGVEDTGDTDRADGESDGADTTNDELVPGAEEWWADLDDSIEEVDMAALMDMDMTDRAVFPPSPSGSPAGETSPRNKLKLVLWMNGQRVAE